MKFNFLVILPIFSVGRCSNVVVNTWSGTFEKATATAYNVLINPSYTALDAIEIGGSTCEANQCDGSVGYGNHPDTRGHTSLDAMIMDGTTMDVGSVGYIRKYRSALSLARLVMEYTDHTLLVGDGAEEFADMLGLVQPIPATTNDTISSYKSWIEASCQPNYYRNLDGCEDKCGPYSLADEDKSTTRHKKLKVHKAWATKYNHDTIGMVVLNDAGIMACGTTTNGANHKIAGRIGDSPIAGAGCYVNNEIGGAAATGDGDIMMRFLPSFAAVKYMEAGMDPTTACQLALKPIIKYYSSFSGGIVCLNKDGVYGGAAYNVGFTYSVASNETNGTVEVVSVESL